MSGIVVLVKYSIALAFSLGGIAAAVRFRNSLDDSKDAAYVFSVMGVGIAAAVDIPVSLVISVLFNLVIVLLWATDFGRTPMELEGRVAERRLQRARQLARTGTFVARIDDEVLSQMTSEQLDGIAQRAMRRAREHDVGGRIRKQERVEARLRLRTKNGEQVLPAVEAQLAGGTKRWSVSSMSLDAEGITLIEYLVLPKKSKSPEELLAAVRAAGGTDLSRRSSNDEDFNTPRGRARPGSPAGHGAWAGIAGRAAAARGQHESREILSCRRAACRHAHHEHQANPRRQGHESALAPRHVGVHARRRGGGDGAAAHPHARHLASQDL